MSRYRVCWLPSAILCATVGIPALGCSGDVQDLAGPSSAAPSALASCAVADASGAWWSQDFPDQAGQFRFELDATPQANALDAVVGLAAQDVGDFAALAAIVRFNEAG